MAEPVKGKTEAGRRREARARQTRARIVAAATDLFLSQGYAATTVTAIAQRADVAPATVYQAFGTKAAVLTRALEEAIVGDDGTEPLLERPWVRAARDEDDPTRRLRLVAEGAAQVAARTAALKAVARDAAATEAEMRALLTDDDARRLETQQALVEIALGRRARAEEVAAFYLLVNSTGHDLASEHLGWSTSAWSRWLGATLTRLLLDDPVPDRQPDRSARGPRPGAPARPAGEDGTR